MLELADIIERTGRVDLGSFITLNGCDAPRLPAGVVETNCDTTGCIAGWACAIWSPDTDRGYGATAAALLDLTTAEANTLFYDQDNLWCEAFNLETDDENRPVDFDTYEEACRNPHLVADMLRRIASGELTL